MLSAPLQEARRLPLMLRSCSWKMRLISAVCPLYWMQIFLRCLCLCLILHLISAVLLLQLMQIFAEFLLKQLMSLASLCLMMRLMQCR